MSSKDFICSHSCKTTCGSLNEALRRETASIRFYESILDECDTPEIKQFVSEVIDTRRKEMLKMISKLNEIHARSQIVDGVISSFNE